jgi:hypothetical protein
LLPSGAFSYLPNHYWPAVPPERAGRFLPGVEACARSALRLRRGGVGMRVGEPADWGGRRLSTSARRREASQFGIAPTVPDDLSSWSPPERPIAPPRLSWCRVGATSLSLRRSGGRWRWTPQRWRRRSHGVRPPDVLAACAVDPLRRQHQGHRLNPGMGASPSGPSPPAAEEASGCLCHRIRHHGAGCEDRECRRLVGGFGLGSHGRRDRRRSAAPTRRR